MREIGSEFWDVPVANRSTQFFRESVQWFLSGRSALQSIIRDLHGCRTVAMPSWCCDSMIIPFARAGIEVCFYPVYWQDGLIQEIRTDCDALFLMDYFGYTGPRPDLNGYRGVVIRDVTHSIFSAEYDDADYCFGSLRKWCGVWTGGYARAKDRHPLPADSPDDGGYTALRKRAMELKRSYLTDGTDRNGDRTADKRYLKVFAEAEELLERAGMLPAAKCDVELAERLDVEMIRTRRRNNAAVLRSALPDWLVFPELSDLDCPMFVPVLVPGGQRDALRRFLIQAEIYCPVHWPVSEYHRLDERERFLYDNELSLVCDQRYSEDDMYRITETINQFERGT